MMLSQATTETLSRYVELGWQVVEFAVVTLLVYLFGRFALEPVVRWV